MNKLLLLFVFILGFSAVKAQVVINEFSCSNLNTLTDAFGENEDWIELYNTGAAAINLSGYYLSDDPNDLQKFQIIC